MMDQLPQDPIMLLSYINTMLRDKYSSLDDLCRSLDVDQKELMTKLGEISAEYMPEINQFR